MPGSQKVPGSRRPHYRVAEAALRYKIPKSWRVLHLNGRRADIGPANLVVCDSERAFTLLAAVPSLIEQAVWLGEPGASVRLLRNLEPKGERFCIRCHRTLPLDRFKASANRNANLRWFCVECA